MRMLAVAAAAILSVAQANATASIADFAYTGSIVTWTVPTTGVYAIDAFGAQGGYGPIDGTTNFQGGRGAELVGDFTFSAGTVLQIAVGGKGSSTANNYNGGGGGGTFVVSIGGSPLLVAGGGGGVRSYAYQNGSDASVTEYAKTGVYAGGTNQVKTSDLGQGGVVSSSSYGGGGAGFYSNGATDMSGSGQSWANGLAGGAGYYVGYCTSVGGFGGGGSGTGCGGGGGGGGYSGGDGGWVAGGGGSYNSGFDQIANAGVGYGDGKVSIFAISAVPEGSNWALMLAGLALTGAALRKRKSA